MATASAVPTRSVNEKFTRVPNSFIENQHLFKLPASRALALIVFRSEQDQARWHGKITDSHWESWTGLGVRAKELACKELQGFGMQMDGRGDKAKFSWDWDRWNEAISTNHQGEYDPKRKEREAKAVEAKAGAKVHEECRDQGCAMLRAGQCSSSTTEEGTGSKPASGLFLTKIAQPVTQTVEQAAWAVTMAALWSFFPLVGTMFLARLLQVVRGHFPDISDAELAQAVKIAYAPGQRGEGLFLWRVPLAIRLIRKRKKDPSAPVIPEEYKQKAREILQDIEGATDSGKPSRWDDADETWARETLFESRE